jgi:hypothetical protein
MVDGLLCVPIDIGSIKAVFTFDGSSGTSAADATITYAVGPTSGSAIFDLRQDIAKAWLDGASIPVAWVGYHNLGGEPFTDLRVLEPVHEAGTGHTLQVQYDLAMPNSQMGGMYTPVLEWSPGPSLKFAFGLSDMNRARYLEAWLPANLIFDQFSISLEIRIINTPVVHSIITNGSAQSLGTNHWQIEFPDRFTALSPLLEVWPAEELVYEEDTVLLPVSGKIVTVEVWKPQSSAVDLPDQITTIKNLLAKNEEEYGSYLHDGRYTAFFNGSSGMEYEGGCTVAPFALSHETFHNWFARGIKPASQSDGWWDEGFATFNDEGADDAFPFDFSEPPVILCSRNPWQRNTPDNSYSDGSKFWKHMASLLGIVDLKQYMRDLYLVYKGKPVSSMMIEEYLLSKSGNAQVVDAFHRFVYGLPDPSPPPDLWLKDAPGHNGTEQWEGIFWDSQDLWIRNKDDDGTEHQPPKYGQDNWFYAKVRNNTDAGPSDHFVVTFHTKGFAGTEFVYPGDFLPCIAAKAEFNLQPGEDRIVKARWPKHLVPPARTHTCLLAAVITRSDHPALNRYVWEQNNLIQKNLTVANLDTYKYIIIPIVISNYSQKTESLFELEVWRPTSFRNLDVSLVHSSRGFFRRAGKDIHVRKLKVEGSSSSSEPIGLECGGHIDSLSHEQKGMMMTSDFPDLILHRFPDSWEATFPSCEHTGLTVKIPPCSQMVVGLKVTIPGNAEPGENKVHFAQRSIATGRIIGGMSVLVNIGDKNKPTLK